MDDPMFREVPIDPGPGDAPVIFVRAAWPPNYDVNMASDETALVFTDEDRAKGKTQQQFKDEVDINTIVRRFGLTGELPDDFRPPQYGDFTEVHDYQTALNSVIAADEAFMKMPAELRARFSNDPQLLIEFLNDGNNRAEAEKLGLVNKPPEKTRDVVQAVDELAAKLVPPK